MTIAVIVPALNEAASIGATLASVADEPGVETIVVDGGSRDGTAERAVDAGARLCRTTGGRAAQQNAGAAATTAEHFVFLHADTCLPAGWAAAVRRTLADPAVALGAFALAIDGASPAERLVAAGATWRSRSWGLPYGDQALFLRRTTFEALGGFAPLPIMEDWDLARRARRLGRIRVLDLAARTSPRRWRKLGVARTLWRNQLMLLGWRLGIAPERLASFYRRG